MASHSSHNGSPTRAGGQLDLPIRPRRNRRTAALRAMVRETHVTPADLVLPLFVVEGSDLEEPVVSMPDTSRLSPDRVLARARAAHALGIPAIALFPVVAESLKDSHATESANPDGLLQRTVRDLKDALPDLLVITDVAMDPYSSDGHDGLVVDGKIVNDESVDILCDMALAQAQAGADLVAPSDMMDGRIGYIRDALDDAGFTEVGILAYSAKYASAFYGPFRDALDSAPKHGDKKSYQMDPANRREALREILLDLDEGADMVMVEAGAALPGRGGGGEGGVHRAGGRVPGERRVRHDQGGGGARLARREGRDAGDGDRHQACRRGPDPHLLRPGRGARCRRVTAASRWCCRQSGLMTPMVSSRLA